MKAIMPILLLGFLGLAMADETTVPAPAVPPAVSSPPPTIPDSLTPAANLPGLNTAPRVGLAAAAFAVGAAATTGTGSTGTSGTTGTTGTTGTR